ncbi:hypothetical protein PQZ54_04835 [Luminiphilus sp.]|nr:hypothetical protein [Luminiphilus sp.]
MIYAMNLIKARLFGNLHAMVVLSILLSGCASTGGAGGNIGASSVGPKRIEATEVMADASPAISKPFMVVPIFDPNIPKDKARIEELSIWPEVRRTEAVRGAITLTNKLSDTNQFNGVRVTPDSETSAHLYTLGKIQKSNGRELDVEIKVIGIDGKSLFEKNYKFTVDEYDLDNPRTGKNSDLYESFYVEIAGDIAEKIKKIQRRDINELAKVEELRYADFFEPNFSTQFTTQNWLGDTVITSYPNTEDPMMRRISALKVQDQMFVDNLQTDYQDFYDASNDAYATWQRAAYTETKAASEAKTKAAVKGIVGLLAVAGAVAAGNNAGYTDYGTQLGAVVLAVGGVAAIKGAMGDSKQAKAHKETLSELGKSLNSEIAPRVMELEDTEIELKGSAQEQYASWRIALRKVYEQEQVPDVAL